MVRGSDFVKKYLVKKVQKKRTDGTVRLGRYKSEDGKEQMVRDK